MQPVEADEDEVEAVPLAPSHTVEDNPPTLLGFFMFSMRKGFRRLHKTGGCWFTAEAREFVTDLAETTYDAKRGHCWRDTGSRDTKEPDLIGESSSVDTSNESSSTDEP